MYLLVDINHLWAYRGSHFQTAAAFLSFFSTTYVCAKGIICTCVLLSETDVWLDIIIVIT